MLIGQLLFTRELLLKHSMHTIAESNVTAVFNAEEDKLMCKLLHLSGDEVSLT